MNEIKFRAFLANFVIMATLIVSFAVSFVAAYPKQNDVVTVNNAIYEGKKDSGKIALTFNVYERADNVQKSPKSLANTARKPRFSWADLGLQKMRIFCLNCHLTALKSAITAIRTEITQSLTSKATPTKSE